MKFYFDLLSQPSRSLFIFMKLNEIPFEPMVTKLSRGQHLSNAYKEVNRFKMVPCIISDDGLKLSETVAIFRYLVASNPDKVADYWYPKDLKERAKVDEYLEWQHTNTRSGCAGYVRTKYLEPTISWKGPSKEKIEEAKTKMEAALDLIENIWLSDPSKSFLATKEISFADVLAASEIEAPRIADYDPFEGRPNLKKWHALVREKTNPVYDEAHVANNSLIGTLKCSRISRLWKMYFSYNY